MPNFNRVILIGHLGTDPESRQAGEKTVVSFSVATQRKDKSKTTDWHRVSAWGNTADFIAKYFKKGDAILVEGEIHYRDYEKDGVKHYITEISANAASFAGSKAGPKADTNEIPF